MTIIGLTFLQWATNETAVGGRPAISTVGVSAVGDEGAGQVVRIRAWWQAMLLGLVFGGVVGALYGMVVSVLPGLSGRVWYASLPVTDAALAGAALGLCYGATAGLAGAITLAVDARLARDPAGRSGLAVRVAAAVAAAIGVVVAFLVVALVAELLRRSINLSDLSLLVLVGVPAALAALSAACIAQFAFRPVLTGGST